MKKKAVFVGSFRSSDDGRGGGQHTACQSIIGSELSEIFEWYFFDTTQKTNAVPSLILRGLRGILRLIGFVKVMLVNKIQRALIFTSFESPSIIEKGLLIIVSTCYMENTTVSIRSEIDVPSKFKMAFIRFTFRKVDAVICQSNVAAVNLRKILHDSKVRIVVIPNWLDIREFPHEHKKEVTAFNQSRPMKLLYAGWFEETKGVKELLAAVSELNKKKIYLQLVMCGDGRLLDWMQRKIIVDGIQSIVVIRGWVSFSDLINAYIASDAFILPSYTEGMPNSILEAMATGTAVLASDVGGIPEIVEHGQNGFLFKPRSASEIESTIERLYSTPQMLLPMGNRSREIIEAKHCRETAIKKLKDILLSGPR